MDPSKSSPSSLRNAARTSSNEINRRDIREAFVPGRASKRRQNAIPTAGKDDAWYAEAKRLNDLLVELSPKPCSPGKEREGDTPPEVVGVVRQQQERHLGGLARPARGFLPGTLVKPHGRSRDVQLGEWTPLVVAAIQRHKELGDGDQFPVFLENRKARRTWRKVNPFRRVKQRIKRLDVMGPGECQEGAQRRFMEEDD